jgi:hypothetical protein
MKRREFMALLGGAAAGYAGYDGAAISSRTSGFTIAPRS